MKIIHLLFIVFTAIVFLGLGLQPVHADNANGVSIQNIAIQPSTIKVGDAFTVTATLVNNSTVPIFVGDMGSKDCQGPFFAVTFDNHAKVTEKQGVACSYVAFMERLDPGKKNTGTSPGLFFTYTVTEPGIANVTITFPYDIKNQTDPNQSNIGQSISKSILFTIYENDTNSQGMTTEELNKKLDAAREKISNIMMNNTTDIPFNMVGINIVNSTLDVGIDSTKATLSAEQYKEKIKEIVGDLPITLVIGHIQLLGNSTSEQKDSSTSFVMSPLKQFNSGIAANDVKCGQGFQLIIRSEGGFPACVKYSSVQKLVDWGLVLTRLSVDGLKETYSIGEKINTTISFQGIMHYCDYPQIQVLDSNQNVVLKNKEKDVMCVSDPFIPLPYVTERLDLDSAYGGPIMINDTGSYTLKISLYGNDIEKGFTVGMK
jgi:hypothetical protein